MRLGMRLWIWIAVGYLGSVAVIALVAGGLVYGLPAEDLAVIERVVAERGVLVVASALLLLAVVAGVVRWLFSRLQEPARSVAEQIEVVLRANPAHKIAIEAAPEIVRVAESADRLARKAEALTADIERRGAEARADIEEERNRLAALMSELAQAVVMCNAEGQVLLYNERARTLFARRDPNAAPLGLGRSAFGLLGAEQVKHALDKIRRMLDQGHVQPATRFVTAPAGGRGARVQLAPALTADRTIAGLVFVLDEAGAGDEGRRLATLELLARDARGPVANIRAAAESLIEYPAMDDAQRVRFSEIVAEEARVLSARLEAVAESDGAGPRPGDSLEPMRVHDLVALAHATIEANASLEVLDEAGADELWVRVDSYALVRTLDALAARLRAHTGTQRCRIVAGQSGRFIAIDLIWSGPVVASGVLAQWEQARVFAAEEEGPTIKDVLEQHGAELWSEGRGADAVLRLLLPGGAPMLALDAPAGPAERPEYYDFGLFSRPIVMTGLDARALADLHYTAFDTETTGLHPSDGDEIISIGAVRIVNGRLLRHEVFERLVDPRRPLDPASAKVHGIDASALAGQPVIGVVLPVFHRFCEDTVLVAHNAAFDMRFLEMKEAATGVRFTQPVLDTMLLAELAQPGIGSVRFEAIAERLGVRIVGRHTALGDAIATGEVFLRLVPLLAGVGIVTLRQALDASMELYNAKLKY